MSARRINRFHLMYKEILFILIFGVLILYHTCSTDIPTAIQYVAVVYPYSAEPLFPDAAFSIGSRCGHAFVAQAQVPKATDPTSHHWECSSNP